MCRGFKTILELSLKTLCIYMYIHKYMCVYTHTYTQQVCACPTGTRILCPSLPQPVFMTELQEVGYQREKSPIISSHSTTIILSCILSFVNVPTSFTKL